MCQVVYVPTGVRGLRDWYKSHASSNRGVGLACANFRVQCNAASIFFPFYPFLSTLSRMQLVGPQCRGVPGEADCLGIGTGLNWRRKSYLSCV
jgi:hypothetical protein